MSCAANNEANFCESDPGIKLVLTFIILNDRCDAPKKLSWLGYYANIPIIFGTFCDNHLSHV